VRNLGLLQGTIVQRNGTGLLAARKRDPTVQSPEI
jgi:hypothetical protein